MNGALFLIGFMAVQSLGAEVPQPDNQTKNNENASLSQSRRLTFAGKRAGEGYFSEDGTRMTFSGEREPDNPFYQQYELDLANGNIRRISPGEGKTTCAMRSWRNWWKWPVAMME